MKRTLLSVILSISFMQGNAYNVDELLRWPDYPEKGKWVQRIKVLTPEVLSDISSPTPLIFEAKGMTRAVVRCGKTILTPEGVEMGINGKGTVLLNPKKLPAGPINLQIIADNPQSECDVYELQLWNAASKTAKTKKGMPKNPQMAKGMKLDFYDDFNEDFTVSRDGRGTRWNAHKPTFGDFSGWPFSDPTDTADSPFALRDGYLIIQARKAEGSRGSTGLIAPVDMDGKGYWAKPPFYMECRFMAHSAPGTWPAFWTITNIHRGTGDELDIIEAYGGWGEKAANSTGYHVVTHYWEQYGPDGKQLPGDGKLIQKEDGETSWSQEFHTYGVYVDRDSTIYYRDGKVVHSLPTNSVSFDNSHVFLINYAIGGASGWHIDLERYGNRSNMYVDYVRVYTAK